MNNDIKNINPDYFLKKIIFHLKMRIPFRKNKLNDIFTYYYKNNLWGNSESLSGIGSTVDYTKNIRNKLPKIFHDFEIKTILDAPCGDFNWFRLIDLNSDFEYIGGDIVVPLIKTNQSKYSDFNKKFIYLDITRTPLPKADIWLCRDCFIHLSNRDIYLALDNFLTSNIKYILTTNFPDEKNNTNIKTGDFRKLNLLSPPFSLCNPLLEVRDSNDKSQNKNLSLWRASDIANSIQEII